MLDDLRPGDPEYERLIMDPRYQPFLETIRRAVLDFQESQSGHTGSLSRFIAFRMATQGGYSTIGGPAERQAAAQ